MVDNGVDCASSSPIPVWSATRISILFLGSLDWRPNLDAVRLLLDDIFPRVKAQEPRATLQIVGRKPVDWLRRQVAELPGVELHADVPDVRPFVASAGMLAVPLRIGGGSRLKILEALAGSLPVITTRIGVEGLHLDREQHVTVADAPADMASGIIEMMKNPSHARTQAERGRQKVLERYDWSGLADQLESVWLQTAGKKSNVENQNVPCVV